MKCPDCGKELKLIRDYETWDGRTGIVWYCFNCDGIVRTIPKLSLIHI